MEGELVEGQGLEVCKHGHYRSFDEPRARMELVFGTGWEMDV